MQQGRQNKIHVFDYDARSIVENDTATINECIEFKNTESVTWINIDSVPPLEFLEELRLGFDLHPVIEEDILNVHQRPKVEILDRYIFLRLKMMRFDAQAKKIRSEQVSIVIAPKFAITFQQGVVGDAFESVRMLLCKEGSRVRTFGTDYLAYELLDSIVDAYFGVLDHCSQRIEEYERDLMHDSRKRTLHAIYMMKRDLLNLRRAAWPMREILASLERHPSAIIQSDTKIYFRDISTKLIQVVDSIEVYREMLSGLHDVYLSHVNSRTGDVIKVLTIITTIFMPLSLIAGIYGMNFTHLPGLDASSGPVAIVALMAVIAVSMVALFKSREWL